MSRIDLTLLPPLPIVSAFYRLLCLLQSPSQFLSQLSTLNSQLSGNTVVAKACYSLLSKSDKASMLDKAIAYLKSLQMQVQMMSMGCSMVPMMFPGVQQYMQSMGVGMNPPMVPGASLPNPAAVAAHLDQRRINMVAGPSTSNLSTSSYNQNQPQVCNLADPF